MLTVDESVVIDRPRAKVFEFFADPENVVVYNSNVVEYAVTSGGPQEVGRKARVVVRVIGVQLEGTDELTEFVDGERFRTVSEKSRIPYSVETSFADEGAGTKVTWHQEVESLKGVFKFADALVLKMYSRDVRSNLEKAKALLEA